MDGVVAAGGGPGTVPTAALAFAGSGQGITAGVVARGGATAGVDAGNTGGRTPIRYTRFK